jgi:hypothetical protein
MSDKAGLLAILEDEFSRHPNQRAQDLRKLIVQSVLGGDHLLRNPARFRGAFFEEWATTSPAGRREDAIQIISLDRRTARVHLAPCKAAALDPVELVEMLTDQPLKGGQSEAFAAVWQLVLELAAERRIPLSVQELGNLQVLEGLPHHSASYGFAAYRVINDLTEPRVAAWLRSRGLAAP